VTAIIMPRLLLPKVFAACHGLNNIRRYMPRLEAAWEAFFTR
jgi:hypothetical protein